MKVLLKPELKKFVAEKVRTGQYADASDLVNQAVEVLREQEQFSPRHEAYLRNELKRGLEQLDRGQFSDFNAKTIIAEELAQTSLCVPSRDIQKRTVLMPAGADPPAPLIRRSKLAEEDYRNIWHFIASDNADAADLLLRKFDEKLKLYAVHPRWAPIAVASAAACGAFQSAAILFSTELPTTASNWSECCTAQDG